MYLEVEHVFEAAIDAVEAAMFHPAYPAFLVAHHGALCNVSPQSSEDDGAQLRRRVHYVPQPTFESIGPKKVPPSWFEFVEESVWDKRQHKLKFDHIPLEEAVLKRLTTRGEISLESAGEGKTRRRARWEIKVKNLPFLLKAFGPMAEQMLGREAKRMMDAEARVLGQWLRTREAA